MISVLWVLEKKNNVLFLLSRKQSRLQNISKECDERKDFFLGILLIFFFLDNFRIETQIQSLLYQNLIKNRKKFGKIHSTSIFLGNLENQEGKD